MAKPNVFGPVQGLKTPNAGSVNRDAPIGASQTIVEGDWLKWSSGKLVQAISLPGSDASGSSPGSSAPVAIALAPITTGASPDFQTDRIPVAWLDVDGEVRKDLRVYDATAASTVMTGISLGTKLCLGRWRATSTKWWYYISTTTASGDVTPYEWKPGQKDADTYPVVEVGR